jgi:hypothetical protein
VGDGVLDSAGLAVRLRNHTNIDTEWIRAAIAAVRPPGISGFDVRVSNFSGRGACGRAYSSGNGYHDRACPFLVVRVAKTEKAVRVNVGARKGYLPHNYGSRKEALLFVLAHELRHLWQAKVRRGRRVWGARGVFSERDADAYALSCLRRFRRGELAELARAERQTGPKENP